MYTRTKIICTIGPSVASIEAIQELMKLGMNVARLNFSHGTHSDHGKMISFLKEVREKFKKPLAIMLDTKGPEIRLGKIRNGTHSLTSGQTLWFVKQEEVGSEEKITLTPRIVFDVLEKGVKILLDNGYMTASVIEKTDAGVKVRIEHGGIVRSNSGVNLPDIDINLPVLTEKDIEDVIFGCQNDVDYIAASFVRSAEHITEIRKIVDSQGKSEIGIIAKIENRQGVANFDAIALEADGIMVARGDLGVEMPLAQVPRLQKMMIRKCYLASKPCITATQMLESMILNPRPTRAEASDVANAIYDSTSAVMLSGETAIGKFPLETVRVMKEIIREAESDFDYFDFLKHVSQRMFSDVPSSVAQASLRTAYSANAKAIFAFSTSGMTARQLSRLRPEMPIIAMTPNPKVYHQLGLNWGVIPYLDKASSIEEAQKKTASFAIAEGILKPGDLVVCTAGTPFGRPGTTNMIVVYNI